MTLEPALTEAEIIIADSKAFAKLEPAEQLRLLCTVKTDKENLLAGAKVDVAARTAALKKAANNVMKPLKAKIEDLAERAEAIVEAHRPAIMGNKKTLELANQVIAYRFSAAVEIDDEKRALVELEDMMKDETAEPADRVSAQACLRFGDITIDKGFIHKAAKTAAAWLEGFGIRIVRKERLSINLKGAEEAED